MDVKAIDIAAVNVLLHRAPARYITRFLITQRAVSLDLSQHIHMKNSMQKAFGRKEAKLTLKNLLLPGLSRFSGGESDIDVERPNEFAVFFKIMKLQALKYLKYFFVTSTNKIR